MNKKLFIGLVLALAILPIFSMVIFAYAQDVICYEDLSCNFEGDIIIEYGLNGELYAYKIIDIDNYGIKTLRGLN